MAARGPVVSFILATCNRREVVLHSLEQVRRCGLGEDEYETIVVDNASTDGTAAAIGARVPEVRVLRQKCNRGPCAKNAGLAVARGRYVVFLDDDSFPQPGAVLRMMEHFREDAGLGAAVFTVTLPHGTRECSAYPDVCIGCGTGFRREALLEVGGLPRDFFMAAEEYDLSLRLLDAGWKVRSFDDLHVTHLKTSASRFPRRITRLDARNNVSLALRYFPDPWRIEYAIDWLNRYRMMAVAKGHRLAFWRGAAAGVVRGAVAGRRTISARAFEQFARIEQTHSLMDAWAGSQKIDRLLLIDLGKNIIAYHRAAVRRGMEVVAIADAGLGGRGFRYRGIPIVTDSEARSLAFDGAVISNLSPVHARQRREQWRSACRRPVMDLFAEGDEGPASIPIMAQTTR